MDAHLVCSKLYINPFRFQVANPNQRFTTNVTFATLPKKHLVCTLREIQDSRIHIMMIIKKEA